MVPQLQIWLPELVGPWARGPVGPWLVGGSPAPDLVARGSWARGPVNQSVGIQVVPRLRIWWPVGPWARVPVLGCKGPLYLFLGISQRSGKQIGFKGPL